jgi:hypothetical protein
MKRLIIGLITTVLMGTGLVGVSAGAASAACPYTGCVDTHTSVTGPKKVTKGTAARFCVRVNTGGNGKPKGFVTLSIHRKKGHFGYTATKPFHGKRCFGTPALTKGGYYRVRAHFEGKGAWGNSNDWTHFVVRKG